ncbi:MAG: YbaB/EbfC family nucleoid-associated protein [Acidimicrobiales bacterium]
MEEDGQEGAEDAAEALLPSFGDFLSQLSSATERLEAAADEARSTVVQGSAAGGTVVISLSGELDALEVKIDPALVDASDVSLLEDTVLAALRDALGQIRDLQTEMAEMAEASVGGGLDLSSMLGNLGGMLGNIGDPDRMPGALGLGGGLTSIFGDLMGGGSGEDEDAGADDGPGA